MNFPFYIAKRYAISFSKNSAINIITFIASFGIIAGTMALFVVLSVFSGLRDFSLSFTNATDPDYKLEPTKGKLITLSEDQLQKLNSNSSIASYSKIVEERVMFSFNDKEQVAYLKGVDENFINVSNLNEHLYVGNWLTPKTNEVVVGAEISRRLGLGIFSYTNSLLAYVPKAGKGLIESEDDAFLKAPLNTVGIYNINEEVDSKYVYCELGLAQQLLQLKKNQVSSIELKVKPETNEDILRNELQAIFSKDISIKNKIQLNDSLYKMLNTENIAVYLIFTLVIIIALFNLIGALIMMIIEKKINLKTLLNLGTSLTNIRKVFLFQGLLITFIGGFIGLLLGALLVFLQQKFEFLMITSTLAYPTKFDIKNLFIVLLTIFILGFFASFLASRSVTKKLLE